jgi:hypothetical protein
MRGQARLLCALGLVLLCVAANFQGAYCRGGGGGHGGGGGGHGGGGGGHGSGGGAHEGGGWGGGGGARGTGWWPHRHSAAGETHGLAAWTVSGATATVAAAALLRWL